MKRIKKIVARVNVTIAFFTHLHNVSIRDAKKMMKITNSKKNICSTKNCSYHLKRL